MKKVLTQPAEDLEYTHGDLTVVFRADWEESEEHPGAMHWLAPDPVTRQPRFPTKDNFDDYLAAFVRPEDAAKMAEAIEAGKFGAKARFDAATDAFRNAMMMDLDSFQARYGALLTVLTRFEAVAAAAEMAREMNDVAFTEQEADSVPLEF